jgi:hypothetical protein
MPQSPREDNLPDVYGYRFGHPVIADPIGMEYLLDDASPARRDQLVALRLETVGAVYRLLADEAVQAAQIVTRGAAD